METKEKQEENKIQEPIETFIEEEVINTRRVEQVQTEQKLIIVQQATEVPKEAPQLPVPEKEESKYQLRIEDARDHMQERSRSKS